MTPARSASPRYDLIVVGAGIVGLATAWHAASQGLSVAVVERDEYAAGASIRNFGHICTTAQAGLPRDYALASREHWIALAESAGFELQRAGTIVVARTAAQLAVLEEFHAERGDAEVALLTTAEAQKAVGTEIPELVGAAHLKLDLRVDSPIAVPAVAAHLAGTGVVFRYGENVLSIGDGGVETSRGSILAERVIVAVGHDVDRFFPELAADAQVTRCRLRMLEVDAPGGITVAPGVLTGLSLLRYDGLAQQPSAVAVRAEFEASAPELLEHGVNLMFTQRLGVERPAAETGIVAGRLVIGDTHHYGVTESPFEDEVSDELVLRETARLLGAESLVVRRRWRGVYASSPQGPYLVSEPRDGVTVATVTSGIGMTTALGFAASVLAGTHLPAHQLN